MSARVASWQHEPVGARLVRGSAWGLALAWANRALSLLGLLVLARLLSPVDFGIAAMAWMTMAVLAVISEMGITLFLLRKQDITREYYDAAWTLQLIREVSIGVLLMFCAPLAASYFQEPRAVEVVRWFAVGIMLRGLINISTVMFRKEGDFASDFLFNACSRIPGLITTVMLAIILRNYWALVIGSIVEVLTQIVLSYRMHSFRPRLSLTRAWQILRSAPRILLAQIGLFINESADAFLVGRLAGSAALGLYRVAGEISNTVTHGNLMAIGRGLFPTIATVAEHPERFGPAFINALGAAAVVFIPLAFGLSVVAADAIAFALGEKWAAAGPLLRWLAVYALFRGLFVLITDPLLFSVRGQIVYVALMWTRCAVLVPAVIFLGSPWGVEGMAAAATIVGAVFLAIAGCAAVWVLPISAPQLAGALWRPAIAASVMWGAVALFHRADLEPVVRLPLDVITGAAAYSLSLASLWLVAGRPHGPERAALELVRRRNPESGARAASSFDELGIRAGHEPGSSPPVGKHG